MCRCAEELGACRGLAPQALSFFPHFRNPEIVARALPQVAMGTGAPCSSGFCNTIAAARHASGAGHSAGALILWLSILCAVPGALCSKLAGEAV